MNTFKTEKQLFRCLVTEIKGISYKPFLCKKKLNSFNFEDLEKALKSYGVFLIEKEKCKIAVSKWVSPKRTRSYPYARVYDTLCYPVRITIIPFMKDEGADGDRDFLQWDTISLMSLLGVYVIIGYYSKAIKNKNYENKITSQTLDVDYIKKEIEEFFSFKSDALHWNLKQLEKIETISEKAIASYKDLSEKLSVKFHSFEEAEKRIKEIIEDYQSFSRNLAKRAQEREINIVQPKENISGNKASITIKNYLGGLYYFTCDEVEIDEKNKILYLIEAKHSSKKSLPSLNDIKDSLLKIILYCNLTNLKVGEKRYTSKPLLKLTSPVFDFQKLNQNKKNILSLLEKEAEENSFLVKINEQSLNKGQR